MPTLNGRELLLLKGAGGELFVRFVDRLIRGEAYRGGLAQSEIDTQVRVNIRDGGVDTRVKAAIPRDQSGYLKVPTCWQFKAETAAELQDRGTNQQPLRFLTEEVNKAEVRNLVALGYGYRFCLVGDLPPEKIREWEAHLWEECRKISAAAVEPRVVAADKLATWADRFPAVSAMVRPFPQEIFNLERWGESVRAVTPEYVPFTEWTKYAKTIGEHVSTTNPIDSCLSVQGEAGVGKTRFVFESLLRILEGDSLVMYTSDEKTALLLSNQLATDSSFPVAIVVADECVLRTRMLIEQNVAGCRDRVKFICLSNTGERGFGSAPEMWLEEMPREIISKILEKNFPNVPPERRSAYVDLAGGFIRLSADMCRFNDRLADGDLGPVLRRVEDYIKFRVDNPQDMRALNLLALFQRVGAKGDLHIQLKNICDIASLSPAEVLDVAGRLKDSPGFINTAGRYLYVTPAIVARIAFMRGWEKWVQDDPKAFIEKLHPDLVEPFLEKVRVVATEEVKAAVAATFREWITTRQYTDLTSRDQVERLTRFVETDPDRYLPLLRDLILDASAEVLKVGDSYRSGPRREIIWLCERLAAFPNLYSDCEQILFRLAEHESEPTIGNNATHLWCQLQRVVLSGSSVSYPDRFQILKKRIEASSGDVFDLCVEGLVGVFDSHVSRMGAPATIGGKLRPEDWDPKDNKEFGECWKMALSLLQQLAGSKDSGKSKKAVEETIKHLYSILHVGLLDEAKSVLQSGNVGETDLAKIVETVEEFLDQNDETAVSEDAKAEISKYRQEIRTWLNSITPKSFSGRLRILLSRERWHESLQDVQGNLSPNVIQIAGEALQHSELIEQELDFLMSDAAKSAFVFGNALGQIDREESILPLILGAISLGKNISLAQGYVLGRLREKGAATPALLGWIDKISAIDARAAFEIRGMGGELLDGFSHALIDVDRGRMPATVLSRYAYGNLSTDQIKEVSRRLAPVGQIDKETRHAAIQFLGAIWDDNSRLRNSSSIQDQEVRAHAWHIVEGPPDDLSQSGDYARAELLAKLSKYDPTRSIRLLLDSILLRGYGSEHNHSLRALVSLAPAHPQQVMEDFGKALIDSKKGMILSFGEAATTLIRALPANTVTEWVRKIGLDAAKRIARDLPLPFIDKNDEPIVLEVTLAILNEFGNDEEVCDGFVGRAARSESWWGNPGDHFRAKANAARRFISHENKCVRRWAGTEVQRCEHLAQSEGLRHEERMI